MKEKNLENEMKRVYDLIEEMEIEEVKNEIMSDLSTEELVFKMVRLRYEYFRKGYLACMLNNVK